MTKISAQKVRGTLKSAKLNMKTGNGFGSGYYAREFGDNNPFIEVDYASGSFNHRTIESHTEFMVNKMTEAANVLDKAGMYVMISDATDRSRAHEQFTLFVERFKGANHFYDKKLPFDENVFRAKFADQIHEEKLEWAQTQAVKEQERLVREDENVRKLNLAKSLNSSIDFDHVYVDEPDGRKLGVMHVTMLDGRVNVITLGIRVKQEIDWDSIATAREERYFNALDVELTSITADKYNPDRWDRRTDSFTTKKDQTLADAIIDWIVSRS